MANLKDLIVNGAARVLSKLYVNGGAKINGSVESGENCNASGVSSHTEGYGNTASGQYSHAEGQENNATQIACHVEGYSTLASSYNCHAEGDHTQATGAGSHAEGYYCYATSNNCHAEGNNNYAQYEHQHVQGHYNRNTSGNAFEIGNGSYGANSNAFSVTWGGVVKAASSITGNTTADYAELFEWSDGNTDTEDRVGKFVTLEGNKIKFATNEDDYILGIVSGRPFVIGNSDCDVWTKMYLVDEFNRYITQPRAKTEIVPNYEEVEETIEKIDEETQEIITETIVTQKFIGYKEQEVLDDEGNVVYEGFDYVVNPEYDSSKPYISRLNRPEWASIGMLGVLSVYDDGTCEVNGYCTVNKDSIATKCNKNDYNNTYRVIERVSDNIVKVIFK